MIPVDVLVDWDIDDDAPLIFGGVHKMHDANAVAIAIVTGYNFWLNLKFGWRATVTASVTANVTANVKANVTRR